MGVAFDGSDEARGALELGRALARGSDARLRVITAEVLAAESTELDLLVTGSRRHGPRAAVLLGGTTYALMRGAARDRREARRVRSGLMSIRRHSLLGPRHE